MSISQARRKPYAWIYIVVIDAAFSIGCFLSGVTRAEVLVGLPDAGRLAKRISNADQVQRPANNMNFFAELKRRNAYKVAVAYRKASHSHLS